MANVFTRSNDATPKPNRNTFDGSFVNNLTLKMGQITPCFLKEVIPGDSFQINAKFGFNFQPMVFPVQSDMQANLHFFYVRNRALWRGWQDFITKTQNFEGDSTPPYIKLTESTRHMFETGEIGDYLGIPTVYYGSDFAARDLIFANRPQSVYLPKEEMLYIANEIGNWYTYGEGAVKIEKIKNALLNNVYANINATASDERYSFFNTPYYETSSQNGQIPYAVATTDVNTSMLLFRQSSLVSTVGELLVDSRILPTAVDVTDYNSDVLVVAFSRKTKKVIGYYQAGVLLNAYFDLADYPVFSGSTVLIDSYNTFESGDNIAFTSDVLAEYDAESIDVFVFAKSADVIPNLTSFLTYENNVRPAFCYYNDSYGAENSERLLENLPFASTSNSDGLRISALPFRAVEACYNSFYRDDRNNPLIIEGTPYYNKYIRSNLGGADTLEYKMYQRNWEQDVFTTAVQSPQQGIAPLVGVTAGGQMTFEDEEGKSYYLQATFGEDGHTITGIKSYSSDMPIGTLRAMVDTISTGISINDFRNVNALQRWLETNMRKGLRYKDQIEAHFGTTPTYSELDMPEFLGGMSRKVSMNKVVQTSSDVEGSPLGTLAGSASIFGDGGQPITHYADEHGWIIGFITISPKPVYSQNLSKQLLKTELLDYYFPEFAHIGYQPILNREIAPLQCTSVEGKKLTDVFGYQRAWYEYLSSLDEVHGDFRATMKDYLIHRVFNDVPQLGNDFLTISPDEANEVFANQNNDAKMFGLIEFDVKMKRPIPAIGVPKLEIG